MAMFVALFKIIVAGCLLVFAGRAVYQAHKEGSIPTIRYKGITLYKRNIPDPTNPFKF